MNASNVYLPPNLAGFSLGKILRKTRSAATNYAPLFASATNVLTGRTGFATGLQQAGMYLLTGGQGGGPTSPAPQTTQQQPQYQGPGPNTAPAVPGPGAPRGGRGWVLPAAIAGVAVLGLAMFTRGRR